MVLKQVLLWQLLRKETLQSEFIFFTTLPGKGREERLKISDEIEDAFLGTLWVNETFAIPVDEIEFEETEDGVLIASFDSLSMEEIENDIDGEMMEELEYRFDKK